MKTKGLHAGRLNREPEEKRFAVKWAEESRTTLPHLLGDGTTKAELSERDEAVAATVIQWLGSPVGQSFLAELGYERKLSLEEQEQILLDEECKCSELDLKLWLLIISTVDGMRVREERRVERTDYLATVEIEPGAYTVAQDGKRFVVGIDGSSTATVIRVR